MKLVLFDIDGTILHSGGAGRLAMIQTFYELFDVSDGFDGISMAGKTDPLIIKLALEKHNIDAKDADIENFKNRYFELLTENISKDLPEKRIYDGVNELIKNLDKSSSIKLGLLTGNWEEGAKIKLDHFGLNKYFSFGAFGSDSIDRNELLPIALRRCKDCCTHDVQPQDTVVIGDTPNDVQCAKVHRALSLAVATGSYSVQDLEEHGADWAVKNLNEHSKIIDWILN